MHLYLGKRLNYSRVSLLGGTGIIRSCGNNSQFGSPEGRFRASETKLKLRGGFKPSSIAFAQVNKREYKNAKIGFRSFDNPEYRRITPCTLLYFGAQLFLERGFRGADSIRE